MLFLFTPGIECRTYDTYVRTIRMKIVVSRRIVIPVFLCLWLMPSVWPLTSVRWDGRCSEERMQETVQFIPVVPQVGSFDSQNCINLRVFILGVDMFFWLTNSYEKLRYKECDLLDCGALWLGRNPPMFLRNFGGFLPNYMALQPRRSWLFIVTALRTWSPAKLICNL